MRTFSRRITESQILAFRNLRVSRYNCRMSLKMAFPGLIVVLLLLSACAPEATPPPTANDRAQAGQLTPFTPLPSRTLTPTFPGTATPLPSLTPTPLTHIVKAGEDMFGIAFAYGLPLDAIMTANPTVNPRVMSLGTVLLVPAGSRPTPTVANPTPTPLPVGLNQPACFRGLDGGLTCLALVENSTEQAVENLSGVFRLLPSGSGDILETGAFPPMNLLPPGSRIPLVAFFPAPAPENFAVSAELITALPLAGENARYLPAVSGNVNVQIDPTGAFAQVTGEVLLPGNAASAAIVWVAAVAYDAQGGVVGVRRWENRQALGAGESQPFDLMVYSLGDAIAEVEVLVEARP